MLLKGVWSDWCVEKAGRGEREVSTRYVDINDIGIPLRCRVLLLECSASSSLSVGSLILSNISTV